MKELLAIFVSVFLAELGDKTQLATVLFAATSDRSPFAIFCAAGGALVLSTAIAVVVGQAAHTYLNALPLKLIAGLGFVAIGGWLVFQHFHGGAP
ncbi:MAG TPA: TMEM165/GDT1 family protein [Alphaproteobacteria bacterium]|nr:TMEM165/GDT1 family protein [Alphaproteobacteria bacterium]